MVCALCLAEKELRKSHVIPEFMYESLYDDIHRFHVLSRDPNKLNSMQQKGLREPLLCGNCEQQFSLYERYVSLLFRGGLNLEYERHGELISIKNVDYKNLRLFQLSVLWRASVSTLPFFSQISLGQHQEHLRRMLLAEDIGIPWKYGCMMFSLMHEGRIQNDLIVQPTWTRVDNVLGYRFVFGGHLWVYLVASHQSSKKLETISLEPSGELRLLLSDLFSAPFITDFANNLKQQGKL